MPQSLVDEYEKLTNKDSFKKYQDNLADTVYGKDTHFIKYFYDEKFISALSGKAASVDSVLNNLEKDLAAYAIAMSGE
jgi:acetylglutamate kinase